MVEKRIYKKKIAGEKATEYIKSNMTLGLGTGSTAFYMIEKVGKMVADGLIIQAVATSKQSAEQATRLGIPLISIDEADHIDLVIDGVDEIDADFYAIKGGGGALFREKIVATLSEEVIWIMDDSKWVDQLGEFPLPVEILPYGYSHTLKSMKEFGFCPNLRNTSGNIFLTDNGNYIADLNLGKGFSISDVIDKLANITGVLETGLFLNLCNRIIIGTEDGPRVIENKSK